MYHRGTYVSTWQTIFARSETTTFWSMQTYLPRRRDHLLRTGMTWADDWEAVTELIFLLHLVQDGPPCFVLPKV